MVSRHNQKNRYKKYFLFLHLSIYSLVFLLSPIIAIAFQPFLGFLSDHCKSPLGRRRPFILILGILSFIGLTLILNGIIFGKLFGDYNLKVSNLIFFLNLCV